ncbi:envelope biogenesis factor ElyC [Rahnella sp. AA]|uniref:envelope biogenesis factor ElyC n=1 Tax=Rahnella sp. AA TaxID=2057180 RepID=UPI000C32152F|nr:envelope biogenesis factor ElyC [Rahnella sp. AA]PKE31507.1 envelope biogenesis factor ElyC [Rahnella sp. AA]
MLFILKKTFGGLLLPLPFILILMAIALVLLWMTRWQKTGKVFFSLSWLLLLLLSLQPVADHLLRPLESEYHTYQVEGHTPVKFVVVLGGGYTYNPDWAPSSNLISNSLPRVTEGIRIYRSNPGSKMIFTGAQAMSNPVSSAAVAGKVAESLGVPESDIILLDKPRDTQQEAQQVKTLIGEQPFVLVTSANHLPRALIFFHQQGLNPIPAPANQLAIDSPLNPWEKALPQALFLSHSERAWYETLGRILQWMTLPAPVTK